MTKVIEAIYENGVLRPVEALELPEHERVKLTLELPHKQHNGERQAAFRRFQESVEQGSFHLRGELPTREELHER